MKSVQTLQQFTLDYVGPQFDGSGTLRVLVVEKCKLVKEHYTTLLV